MKPFAAIAERLQIDGREIIEARTLTSKTFDLGGKRRRVIKTITPVHFEIDGRLEEIDLTPRDDGDAWIIDQAPFIVRIAKDRPLVTYEGRVSGRRASFSHPGRFQTEFADGRAWWHEANDKDLSASIRPASLKVETWLRKSNADPTHRWSIIGDAEDNPRGFDAERNPAELQGKRFTGRVSKTIDRKTRRREWRAEPAWPVRIV